MNNIKETYPLPCIKNHFENCEKGCSYKYSLLGEEEKRLLNQIVSHDILTRRYITLGMKNSTTQYKTPYNPITLGFHHFAYSIFPKDLLPSGELSQKEVPKFLANLHLFIKEKIETSQTQNITPISWHMKHETDKIVKNLFG